MIALRSFFAIVALALLSVPVARANDMFVFSADRYEAALADGGPLLVETYSTGCPVCWVQEPTVREIIQKPEFSALRVLVIDVNSHADMLRLVGAQTRSTLIVYKGGKEVGRAVGITNPADIEMLLRKAF